MYFLRIYNKLYRYRTIFHTYSLCMEAPNEWFGVGNTVGNSV